MTDTTLWLNLVLALAAVADAVFAFVQVNIAVQAKNEAAAIETRAVAALELGKRTRLSERARCRASS